MESMTLYDLLAFFVAPMLTSDHPCMRQTGREIIATLESEKKIEKIQGIITDENEIELRSGLSFGENTWENWRIL